MSCFRVRLCAPILLPALVLVLWIACLSARAQTPPKPGAPPKKPAAKRAGSKSPNVKTGAIATIDPMMETVSIKDSAGMTASYTLIEKTRYFKNRREAKPADFKSGESVVVHIRHSRSDGEAQVIELTDKTSWDWLDGIRHNVTTAKIKEIEDDTLTVTLGPDAVPLAYTISDKTLWNKGGKEAKPTDFKAGDSVSIVPRSLPSGSIMASVVADSAQGAAQGKERKATSVHGVIQSVQLSTHALTLKTVAGDTRALTFTDTTQVHLSGKTLPLSALKAGQSVGARIRHDDDDKEIAWSITIEPAGGSKSSKKPGGKMSPKSDPGKP